MGGEKLVCGDQLVGAKLAVTRYRSRGGLFWYHIKMNAVVYIMT